MKNVPRILPLVGVAVGGVLAINALAGAKSLPDMLSGAKAFAEGVAKPEGTTCTFLSGDYFPSGTCKAGRCDVSRR